MGTLPGSPFSRSYGVNLPSSLTEDHPFALEVVFQPTCVGLRYGRVCPSRRGFSGRLGSTHAPAGAVGLALTSRHPLTRVTRYDDAPPMSTRRALPPARVPPFARTVQPRSRIINLVSIAYASRPRLRPD